ncbi:aminopeptidase [Feifania hominis]|uniref:Aminopeptidase n=1 Tax=Feifania hominis TaxID=2763660 RepID=A0A926DCU3_9FIRM|nr:aminopeptidase [Feifania hominis]MBC8536243.1 aminopeptidase [Feifania hominis]
MTRQQMVEKYADLLVRLGVAIQKDETLILELDAEHYELSRAITRAALLRGAKDVVVFYRDPYVDKFRAQYGDRETVETVLPWMKESLSVYLDKGACSLKLASPRPELFDDVDASVAVTVQKFTNDLRNVIRSSWGTNGTRWCIACAPNQDWAVKLYPDCPPDEALDKLWATLMELCMVREDNDPVEDWIDFQDRYCKYSAWFNRVKPDSIHFFDGKGTDLTIGFHPKAYWVGGQPKAERKPTDHMGNLPSNEVASSPDKYRVDGTVHSTRPLVYGGKVIDRFRLTFEKGKVVHHEAEVGEELLTELLNTDEGSRRIGEVAFVECDLPIAKTGMVFYNTLLDENAACHLALGNGYALCLPGISWTDKNEWEQWQLNSSCQHVDFMFGSPDMNAVVTTQDGRELPIFQNGKFLPVD